MVYIELGFISRQETRCDTTVSKLVFYFANLDKEVFPFLVIIAEQTTFLVLLRDDNVGGAIRIFPSLEVSEIALGQELLIALVFTSEFLFREDILFVDGVAFAKCGHQRGQQV